MRRRHLGNALVLAALLAGAAGWVWVSRAGPAPLPPPGRLTIHGVAPGMHWSEVASRLGGSAGPDGRTGKVRFKLGDETVVVRLSPVGVVTSVTGDRLEFDGVPGMAVNDPVSRALIAFGEPEGKTVYVCGTSGITTRCLRFPDRQLEIDTMHWTLLFSWSPTWIVGFRLSSDDSLWRGIPVRR